ncbi:RNA polymerase sigma-70 factor, ECF subfamily [Microlunatus soli]|uniref:RNA polymerase sigma-70 factor, ECF subfamily n=2 Tax=Microlunatus soli TaxID=630515 RepID=A0A1H1PKX9_9ACTN|nr:RNA polymerase sigma-70 factor, ECF subfamily [Microlunatus soli]
MVEDEFNALVEPLRRELVVHCYRMMGSIHDAEEQVQETYIRAWRAFHGFERRSSVRTWLYKIATNTCLTALQSRTRRPVPTGLGQPAADPRGPLEARLEIDWLEPLPDAMIWAEGSSDPAEVVITKDSVRLAYIAALQLLTAQQRAVIILREVLQWRAQEVADALDLSVASVNSSLQRARAHLAGIDAETLPPIDPSDERTATLIKDFADAFEQYDVTKIVSLLADDAIWEMPPFLGWYQGAENIGALISNHCPADGPGDQLITFTWANGAPVLALYMRSSDGSHRAFQLQQLTIGDGLVQHVECYFDTRLFAAFGLPDVYPAD